MAGASTAGIPRWDARLAELPAAVSRGPQNPHKSALRWMPCAQIAGPAPGRIRAGSRRWLGGLGLAASVACGSAGDGDLQDLAEPGGGPAEAEVGHVQCSVIALLPWGRQAGSAAVRGGGSRWSGSVAVSVAGGSRPAVRRLAEDQRPGERVLAGGDVDGDVAGAAGAGEDPGAGLPVDPVGAGDLPA